MNEINSLSNFFNARGVAVLGASTNPNKLSYGIVRNLIQYHYGGQVYPINPNTNELLGLKAYPTIASVPDPVDLAVIVLPVNTILGVLTQCGERGIKNVIIITGGFKEIGSEGAATEQAAAEVARAYNMRVIGPNCVGALDVNTGLDATFLKGMPDRGPIAFISQSGALCGGIVDLFVDSGVGFSHFVSLGNEMDVTESDMLAYFDRDPHVRVIALYVEGLKDGQRFMRLAREVSRRKPIIMLKAGRNEAGARAVSSHTGSLAGAYTAYQAALKQSGVIEVDTVAELFNTAWALGTQKLPAGKRVAIVTNAGGAAALASDSLAAHGFTLASISAETQAALRQKLNPSAQVANPIDLLGGATPEEYLWSLSQLQKDPGVDLLLPILVPQALVSSMDVAQSWVEAARLGEKPLISCLMGHHSTQEAATFLNRSGIPVYTYPDEIGPVCQALADYENTLSQPAWVPAQPAGVDLQAGQRALQALTGKKAAGEVETRLLLQAYGIQNVPGGMASNIEEAVLLAGQVGFPVVMKIVSDDILHKSEAGGIKLNIHNQEQLRVAYNEMMRDVTSNVPGASIRGVMVEAMASKGQEVIVGLKQDATFGPMLMFGMGGVLVELIKDVSYRVAPLSMAEIYAMIVETAAGKLLKGYRGGPAADLQATAEVIARLAQLGLDHPEILEIEINPLVVYPQGRGALALDSRMILKA